MAPEDLRAAHGHLDRLARLARQTEGEGLEVHHRLAAEAAADLGRGDPNSRDVHAEQLRAVPADRVLPLGGAPDLRLAVLRYASHAGVRLDVALVDRLGIELALDHDVGFREPGLDVALSDLDPLDDVGGLVGLRIDPFGEEVVVQYRGVRFHRRDGVDDVGQHLVVHLDEIEGPGRDGQVDGGDRRDGVPVVEHLLVGKDVLGHVPVVDHGLAGRLETRGEAREVGARQHRLDSRQGLRLRGVEGADPGVGVRASKDTSDQHVREGEVRAEAGPSRDLVHPVRTYRPSAYPPESLAVARHPPGSLSSWRARSSARRVSVWIDDREGIIARTLCRASAGAATVDSKVRKRRIRPFRRSRRPRIAHRRRKREVE